VPRIRSVKPEHRTHRKVGVLSDLEYRLWISMINEADDEGRLVAEAGQLRILTWPYHPNVTTADVEQAIQTIAGLGLIQLYQVSAVRYAAFPSWKDHQHPKYPTASKLPVPPPSNPLPQPLPEDFPQTFPQGLTRERRGVESSKEESSKEESSREEMSRESQERKGSREGEPASNPSANPSRISTRSDNGRGKRTVQPPRGTWDAIIAEVKRQHPDLSDADQVNLAMRQFDKATRP